MPTSIQRRGGTASAHNTFTGADRELTVNTTNKSVHVHDGSTAGGVELARADLDNVTSNIGRLIDNGATTPGACSVAGDLFYNTADNQLYICDGSNYQAAGVAGDSIKPIYQRSAAQPATPAASATVPTGWYDDTANVPAGADPIWVAYGVKPSGATNFTWQEPVQLTGADGSDGAPGVAGVKTSTGYLYYTTQVLESSPPTAPTVSNYDFTTGEFGTVSSGWSSTVSIQTPTEGYAYFAVRYSVIEGTPDTITLSSVFKWQNFDGLVTFTNIEAGIDDNVTTIDGGNVNLINLNASNISTGTLTADYIANGAVTSGVEFQLGTGVSNIGTLGAGASFKSTTTKAGVMAANTTAYTAFAAANVGGSSVFAGDFYNATSSTYGTFNTTCNLASSGIAGNFQNIGSTTGIQLATASYAYITNGGASGTFTGAHDGLLPISENPAVGDIIVDVEAYAKPNVFDTITKVAVSSSANQATVVGVYAKDASGDHIQPALSSDMQSIDEQYTEVFDTHKGIVINSIGEGQINVCAEGGDIAAGDLIVTSSTAGKGMKQSDDIVRSKTVAKAREAVTFSSPSEVQQIACIYLCG